MYHYHFLGLWEHEKSHWQFPVIAMSINCTSLSGPCMVGLFSAEKLFSLQVTKGMRMCSECFPDALRIEIYASHVWSIYWGDVFASFSMTQVLGEHLVGGLYCVRNFMRLKNLLNPEILRTVDEDSGKCIISQSHRRIDLVLIWPVSNRVPSSWH